MTWPIKQDLFDALWAVAAAANAAGSDRPTLPDSVSAKLDDDRDWFVQNADADEHVSSVSLGSIPRIVELVETGNLAGDPDHWEQIAAGAEPTPEEIEALTAAQIAWVANQLGEDSDNPEYGEAVSAHFTIEYKSPTDEREVIVRFERAGLSCEGVYAGWGEYSKFNRDVITSSSQLVAAQLPRR